MIIKKYFIKDLINDNEYVSITDSDFIQLLNELKKFSEINSHYVISNGFTKKLFYSDDDLIGYCIY